MDAEMKAKWVEALRSGKFEQATEQLKSDGGYCCLGVLCIVAGASWQHFTGVDEETGDYLDLDNVPVANGECLSAGEDQELGSYAMKKFGITNDHQRILVAMNDGIAGEPQQPFPVIADFIEKNL